MKTAYLIGGYARSGKSTMMSLLSDLGKNTVSTSRILATHAKALFPDLLGYIDCTTDSAKAMSWDTYLIDLESRWVQDVLKSLGYATSDYQCMLIVDDFYARLGGSPKVTLRQLMVAVAESHRMIFPDIYVDLTLNAAKQCPVVYIETIGGKELYSMTNTLKSEGYHIIGLNIRAESEQAGIDIRELIRVDQCDELYVYYNSMKSKQEMFDWLITSNIN